MANRRDVNRAHYSPGPRRLACVVLCTAVIILTGVAADTQAQAYTHEVVYGRCAKAYKKGSPGLNMWVPPGAENIRGVLMVMENTANYRIAVSGNMRSGARRHKLAIMYLRCSELIGELAKGTDAVEKMLDTVAHITNIPDFRHAPWIGFGLSSVCLR